MKTENRTQPATTNQKMYIAKLDPSMDYEKLNALSMGEASHLIIELKKKKYAFNNQPAPAPQIKEQPKTQPQQATEQPKTQPQQATEQPKTQPQQATEQPKTQPQQPKQEKTFNNSQYAFKDNEIAFIHNRKDFITNLLSLACVVSKNKNRPQLNCINLKTVKDKNKIILTATDSAMLIRKEIEADIKQDFEINIFAKPLTEAIKDFVKISSYELTIKHNEQDNLYMFNSGDKTAYINKDMLCNSDYPAMDNIVKQDFYNTDNTLCIGIELLEKVIASAKKQGSTTITLYNNGQKNKPFGCKYQKQDNIVVLTPCREI